MATPFIGEITLFAGNFAPAGWAFCDGSLINIAENEALFSLIGTTYGGDGQFTFALPDLRGRLPIHQGNHQGNFFGVGQTGGVETVTLSPAQLPAHSHLLTAAAVSANQSNPANQTLSQPGFNLYSQSAANTNLNNATLQSSGGNQPHENMQPYLCVSFIISLYGIYPSRA